MLEIKGIEFIGNISPDNKSAGKKPIPKETWLARNWFFNLEEIKSPIPDEVNKNKEQTPNKTK